MHTALSPFETGNLRYLDPDRLALARHGDALRLTLEGDRCYLQVSAVRAFPLSEPLRYISLRDATDDEIGIVADAAALDEGSRRLLEEELDRRYMVPVITAVLGIVERFGSVEWRVATDRGERSFTTRNLRENVTQPAPTRYLISDVDGNRFDIRDIAALDAASQRFLMRHL
jgi:hypothetical protein